MPVGIDNSLANIIFNAASAFWIIRRTVEVASWRTHATNVDGRLVFMGGTEYSTEPSMHLAKICRTVNRRLGHNDQIVLPFTRRDRSPKNNEHLARQLVDSHKAKGQGSMLEAMGNSHLLSRPYPCCNPILLRSTMGRILIIKIWTITTQNRVREKPWRLLAVLRHRFNKLLISIVSNQNKIGQLHGFCRRNA